MQLHQVQSQAQSWSKLLSPSLGAIIHSYIRHLIRHMTGTSEHSVSIIEFDLGMIELHARNCSIAY